MSWALLLALPLLLGLWALARPRAAPNLGHALLRGFGWVELWVLPVVVLQLAEGASSSSDDWGLESLWVLPIAAWVHLGGWSVQRVFEASVSTLFGSRQATLSHPGWYLALAAVQCVGLALVVAWRLRRSARWTDPVVLLVGALALANALLGRSWPWGGT